MKTEYPKINCIMIVVAFFGAFVIANVLCLFYSYPLLASPVNSYRVEPNRVSFQAREGYALTCSDENGFSNRIGELKSEEYLLVMGSSHAAGFCVPMKKRFSDILDSELAARYGDDSPIYVYNVAKSGSKLYDVSHNIQQLVNEFPNPTAVIVEMTIPTSHISDEQLEYALDSADISIPHGSELTTQMNDVQRISIYIKSCLPFLDLLHKQYVTWKNAYGLNLMPEWMNGGCIESSENNDEINRILECIRYLEKQCNGELILLLHRPFEVDENGMPYYMEDRMYDTIVQFSKDERIRCVDMSETFCSHFSNNHEFPYGFNNTSFGAGHLNEIGHRLIAEELLKAYDEEIVP